MRRPTATIALAAALVLAACGTADDAETTDDPPEDEQSTEAPDDDAAAEDPAAADDPAAAEDPLADLPDLEAQVEDGVFRGEGIVLPIPDGWQFEPAAQLQGQVVATGGDEGLQQIFGQAVDADDLPETVTFEELLESNRAQFEEEPAVDEEIELEGAEVAHQLRYDALPATQEGLPPVSIVLLVAESPDGHFGSFNYAAATDEFEDAVAERFVTETGFDPDSDPTPLQLPDLEGEPETPTEPEDEG